MTKTARLLFHLVKLTGTETALNAFVQEFAPHIQSYIVGKRLLDLIRQISVTHHSALQSRIDKLTSAAPSVSPVWQGWRFDCDEGQPVTSGLTQLLGLLNQQVASYAVLRAIALRAHDSILNERENTADLALAHMRAYVEQIHAVFQILHEALLWEMERAGECCTCSCPACSHGICLCGQGARRSLSDVWQEFGPISQDDSVYLHPPRGGSAAGAVGLGPGDRILSAAGHPLKTHFVLQQILQAHEKGDHIPLSVRRSDGELEDVILHKQ